MGRIAYILKKRKITTNRIIDSQHIACLLLKRYGGNKKIKVLKIYKA